MNLVDGGRDDGIKDDPEFQHEGEGSIFSQNLELDFTPQSPAKSSPERPEQDAGELDSQERGTYFQVEAGKVVDILREGLQSFSGANAGMDMIDQLWDGWRELWGYGRTEVEREFADMFSAARQAFEAAVRHGSVGLSSPEKLALARLLEGMEKLANGESDEDDLQWCREAGNRVLRMIAAWENVDGESDLNSQPEIDMSQEDDISGSIDEWFSQVSRFIPQSADELEDELPAGPANFFTLDEEPVAEEPEPAEQVEVTQPEEPVFSADETEVIEETAAKVEPEPTAAAEVVDDEEPVKQPQEMAGQVEEVHEDPEEIVFEGSSEGWLSEVYFIECCLEAAETIRNNADRLQGAPSGRTAKMLCNWVEYLIQLSADFGIPETDTALHMLKQRLESIAAAGRTSDAAKVEQLLSALSSLERECEKVTVAVC